MAHEDDYSYREFYERGQERLRRQVDSFCVSDERPGDRWNPRSPYFDGPECPSCGGAPHAKSDCPAETCVDGSNCGWPRTEDGRPPCIASGACPGGLPTPAAVRRQFRAPAR